MIRFILSLCALLFAAVSSSFAADMPGGGRYQDPAYFGPAAFNWSGFYLGLNGGYGWGSSDWSGSVATGSTSPGGGLFGGTVGFNLQSGAFVYGVEGDVAGSWIRSSTSTGTGFCSFPGCQIQTSWFATARGRIGYAFDRVLLYVTAGGAFGDVQMSTGGLSATSTNAGWTAGLGLEYAFLGPWSAKAEYLYADLGSGSCGLAICGGSTTASYTVNIFRVGVNYKFW
ncbi:MAG TPA: outer membrane protein [Pseudolabrys sp.]|nr:outer membrane protein [Pseudolabrys sp.]